MTTLKIKVTKDILEKSKTCGTIEPNGFKGHSCAIALAVRDIFPTANIGFHEVWPLWNGYNYTGATIRLPNIVSEYIKVFDRTPTAERPMLPEIEFEIEIPDSVIEKINIEELKPLLENHPTLELIKN